MTRRVTAAEIDEIKRLAAEGHGPVTIAKKLGRGYDTVRLAASKAKIPLTVRGRQGARQGTAGASSGAGR